MPKLKLPSNLTQKYEERAVEELKLFRSHDRHCIIPAAAHAYKVGDLVEASKGTNATIMEILDDGRLFHLKVPTKSGRFQPIFQWWVHVSLPVDPNTATRFYRPRIHTQYRHIPIRHFLHTCYNRGFLDSPKYQREYTWSLEDKQRLIRSIFDRVDLGKIVLIEMREDERYEIVDGKQRIRAIMDFYEGRFAYEGVTFQQLSWEDRFGFWDHAIQVAQLDEGFVSESDILHLFLSLNTGGVPQTEEHIAKVRVMYQEALRKEGKL